MAMVVPIRRDCRRLKDEKTTNTAQISRETQLKPKVTKGQRRPLFIVQKPNIRLLKERFGAVGHLRESAHSSADRQQHISSKALLLIVGCSDDACEELRSAQNHRITVRNRRTDAMLDYCHGFSINFQAQIVALSSLHKVLTVDCSDYHPFFTVRANDCSKYRSSFVTTDARQDDLDHLHNQHRTECTKKYIEFSCIKSFPRLVSDRSMTILKALKGKKEKHQYSYQAECSGEKTGHI
ncbi:hypothetical protein CAPTEDRAFT_218108 [Capitella teleta]|uniref:Uncharacterized protein n=1 Tax=Capitella teleta TaxID=283909 RepID=R7U7E4_CAPTE|nr:hypothetical protein CAPTEDRAFT_218108 [Capitella teleta]|eukprot:ELU02051.1 hypothetical protein CAPTEDRAFT_218108 [Capitella teleta]